MKSSPRQSYPRLIGVVQYPHKLPPFPLGHARGLLRDLFTFQHPANALDPFAGQLRAAQAVILERAIGRWHPVLDHFADRIGIDPDFVLGVGVRAQAQKVEEVVQIHFPVPLGIDVGGQVHARQFPCQALLVFPG